MENLEIYIHVHVIVLQWGYMGTEYQFNYLPTGSFYFSGMKTTKFEIHVYARSYLHGGFSSMRLDISQLLKFEEPSHV